MTLALCTLLLLGVGEGLDGGADAPLAMADAGMAAPQEILRELSPFEVFTREHFHGTATLTRVPMLYEASFVVGAGGYVHTPGLAPVPLTGVLIRERSGLISRLLVELLGNVLLAFGSVRIDSYSQKLGTSIEVRNGVTYEVTRIETTTTYTATKTQAQFEREQAQLSEGIAGLTWVDLTVYGDRFLGWDRGAPGGNGYEFGLGMHLELFALLGHPAVLDIGLHLANVRIQAPAGLGISNETLYWASGGIVSRFHLPLGRFAAFSVEWIANFLSLDYLLEDELTLLQEGRVVTSPLKLGVELYATDHVVLRAAAVLGGLGFTDGRLGVQLTAGVRL